MMAAGAERQAGGPAGRERAPGARAGRSEGRSRAVEDYLKAVWKLQQPSEPVSTTALAEELGRSAASVTNMVKALAERGLLEHVPYHGVRLTPTGEITALRIVRRHRVVELYLVERLGYTWDNVHDEAERLEHAASEELIDRMARALGEPSFDPHGAPIPTREGEIEEPELTRLSELPPDTPAVVREVSDESSEGLRRLADLGLFPGTRVRVAERRGEREALLLEVEGRACRLDRALAGTVSVEVL